MGPRGNFIIVHIIIPLCKVEIKISHKIHQKKYSTTVITNKGKIKYRK